jgi:hypothetical protein
VAQSRAATWHPFIGLLFMACYLKVMGPWGSTPGPPSAVQDLTSPDQPMRHALILVSQMKNNIFDFTLGKTWREVGLGLSPSPWSPLGTRYDQ